MATLKRVSQKKCRHGINTSVSSIPKCVWNKKCYRKSCIVETLPTEISGHLDNTLYIDHAQYTDVETMSSK